RAALPIFFGLMIGVALAFSWAAPRSPLHTPAWQRLHQGAALAAALALGWLMTVLDADSAVTFRGGILAASLLTAVLVAALPAPGSLYQRVLDLPPMVSLGQRSYGIYLWHWPVMLI